MTRKEKIHLKISEDDDEDVVAYLTLPDHPGRLHVVKKNVRLRVCN